MKAKTIYTDMHGPVVSVDDYDILERELNSLQAELQEQKDLNKELVAVIDEIHDKWITASNYWGSPANEKAEALIKKSQV